MPIKKKRCQFCRNWFPPDPRSEEQISCTNPLCQKQRKAATDKAWRQRNPGYDKSRADKKYAWARECAYYPNYRRTHTDYTARDNKRRSNAHKAHKYAANQVTRRKIAVGRLESLRHIPPDFAANQDAIARRVEVLADYLFPEERAANRNTTDFKPASGP